MKPRRRWLRDACWGYMAHVVPLGMLVGYESSCSVMDIAR